MLNLRTVPGLLFTFVIWSVTTLLADFCYATLPPPPFYTCMSGPLPVGEDAGWSEPEAGEAFFLLLPKHGNTSWKNSAVWIESMCTRGVKILLFRGCYCRYTVKKGWRHFRPQPGCRKRFLQCTKQRFVTIPELLHAGRRGYKENDALQPEDS